MGKFDHPDAIGDVNHFQALTTALSATVGIGNIAGVAIAIHYGGPGALFWMWITAFFGMAVKYTECTLAVKYRVQNSDGSVSGGPMYYIEKGLGEQWKWLAVFFAAMAVICSFLTGNAVQANTVADTMKATFLIPGWITGLATLSCWIRHSRWNQTYWSSNRKFNALNGNHICTWSTHYFIIKC